VSDKTTSWLPVLGVLLALPCHAQLQPTPQFQPPTMPIDPGIFAPNKPTPLPSLDPTGCYVNATLVGAQRQLLIDIAKALIQIEPDRRHSKQLEADIKAVENK
jgi:hypothetical protein